MNPTCAFKLYAYLFLSLLLFFYQLDIPFDFKHLKAVYSHIG